MSTYRYESLSTLIGIQRVATANGYVTIRLYGLGNGYHSETASFRRVAP